LKPKPQNFCYRVKRDETVGYLVQVGQLLLELVEVMTQNQASAEIIQVVERVLQDLYVIDDEEQVTLRPTEEIPGSALQSPHDPESIQLAPNSTDDGQMLAESLAEQTARGIAVERMTVDGGYTGQKGEQACQSHQVQMLPTRIRGRRSAPDRWGWEEYTWLLDKDGCPQQVVCPQGQSAQLDDGRKDNWLLARFDRTACTNCLFYQQQCQVKPYKHKPPSLFVSPRWIQVALLRQGMSPANFALRAGVESTVRSFKHVFPAGKLPVRSLIRTVMVASGAALMVNCRRVHHYRQQQRKVTPEHVAIAVSAALMGLKRPAFWNVWAKVRHSVSHLRAELLNKSNLHFLPQFAFA
jgi:hypothetical protein